MKVSQQPYIIKMLMVMAVEFQPSQPPTHNALDDAKAQGEMFERLLGASAERRGPNKS
jgi:hypothetical protein